jgi:VanZ family protein
MVQRHAPRPWPTSLELTMDAILWAITLACAGTTLWFSFGAPPPGANLFEGADKVGHAIAYYATTLSFLFAAVWRPGRGEGRFAHLGIWFPVAAIAAGALVEILQGLTPTREAQMADLVAEVIGTGLAFVLHALTRWWFTSRPASAHQRS